MEESSFLYDPSENINRGFAQFQAGLGNAFSQLIAQKQNDYVTAEKTFQNIDALTDKLGEYGQEEITGKTSALMNQAAKDIIKNGKLDYSALGDIRSEVTKIKNRKSAIEAGTQMLKDWTQTSLATKDDLTSLTTTLSDLRGILLNPNNLSAQDMGKQMQAAYAKNINTTKVFGDTFKRIAPVTEFTESLVPEACAFRIFQDMRGVQGTYRITPATTTTLTQPLLAAGNTIHVADAKAYDVPIIYVANVGTTANVVAYLQMGSTATTQSIPVTIATSSYALLQPGTPISGGATIGIWCSASGVVAYGGVTRTYTASA